MLGMRVALIGSVSSSWTVLDALIRNAIDVVGVLGVNESQAERISDYRALRPLALQAGIPYCSFIRVDEPAVEAFLRDCVPDSLWVIGLSQLLPPPLFEIAPQGAIGFHPTPLPKGRGRAPVAWTILLDQPAAASLFFLTEEADAGDLVLQRSVPVYPNDYSEDLIARTNHVLAEMVRDLAPRIRDGDLPRAAQDHSQATYYAKRTPADGLIDWNEPTDRIYKLIRAAGRPYPGAFTWSGPNRITVWRARPSERRPAGDLRPGTVFETGETTWHVVTGDGALELTEVELPVGMDAARGLASGVVLGKPGVNSAGEKGSEEE